MATLGNAVELKDENRLRLTLSAEEREQGTYVIGTTGTGKTTLLRNIAVEDMWTLPDHGLCVLDPHGDLTNELLEWVPPHRMDQVVYLNAMDLKRPFGLNLLECDRDDEHQVRWVVSTIMETLHRLFWYSWGPRLEHVLHHTIRTALAIDDSTFIEMLMLLTSREYRDEKVGARQKNVPLAEKELGELRDEDGEVDYLLASFWHEWFHLLSPNTQSETVASTVNKLSPFLLDKMMRHIIGQSESTFDLRKIMDDGKILLVNLSKGDLGENNSALLGSVLVNLILIGALRRQGDEGGEGRKPFHVIVDEYQNFANPSFSILQSEARKFGVDLIVAHQYRDQLDQDSRGASMNVGNFIVFRVSGRDSYMLASQFDNTPPPPDVRKETVYDPFTVEAGTFYQELKGDYGTKVYQDVEQPRRPYSDVEAETANALSTLKNYQAYCRLIRRPEGERTFLGEYRVDTLPHPNVSHPDLKLNKKGRPVNGENIRATCIALSRKWYGKDEEEVKEEILERSGGRISTDDLPPGMIYTDM